MKVKVKAQELDNASVTHISLVRRGANRIPFRIVKTDKGQETAMIDLGQVFKRDKGVTKPGVSTIVGLVVQKGDMLDVIKEAVKKSGFSIDAPVEREDGTVVLKQGDKEFKMEDCSVIKMSDDLALLMHGYEPTETKIVKTEGFVPGVYAVNDAMRGAMTEVFKAEKGADIAGKLGVLLKDYSDFVVAQVKQIPMSAFAAEQEVSLAVKTWKERQADKTIKALEEEKKKEEEAAALAEKNKVKKDEKVEDKDAKGVTAEQVTSIVTGIVTDALKALNVEAQVQKAVEPVTTAVGELKKTTGDLTTKVTATETALGQIQKSVKGVVLGAPPGGDPERAQLTVVKSDAEEEVFDTAFQPNLRKKQAGSGR